MEETWNEQTQILPIGREQVQRAWQTLQKYRAGKQNLEKRVIENQQWYKLRHWECLRRSGNQVEPVSGWLFNTIINKHADAMQIPRPCMRARSVSWAASALSRPPRLWSTRAAFSAPCFWVTAPTASLSSPAAVCRPS